MASKASQLEQEVEALVKDRGWKGHLTIGVISLILWALVSSPLFLALKALVEIILVLGGIVLICYAAYEYFQLQQKK